MRQHFVHVVLSAWFAMSLSGVASASASIACEGKLNDKTSVRLAWSAMHGIGTPRAGAYTLTINKNEHTLVPYGVTLPKNPETTTETKPVTPVYEVGYWDAGKKGFNILLTDTEVTTALLKIEAGKLTLAFPAGSKVRQGRVVCREEG